MIQRSQSTYSLRNINKITVNLFTAKYEQDHSQPIHYKNKQDHNLSLQNITNNRIKTEIKEQIMIILITGTPGTGKTTISPLLAEKLGCYLVDINQLVEEKQLYTGVDPEKGYKIVDLDSLEGELHKIVDVTLNESNCIIIEGHLAHYFPVAEWVIVFRTDPNVLKGRLEQRNWGELKIRENLEAEALDICTWEAYQIHTTNVHEVDTSGLTPEEAVNTVFEIISGKKSCPPGEIDFSTYLK